MLVHGPCMDVNDQAGGVIHEVKQQLNLESLQVDKRFRARKDILEHPNKLDFPRINGKKF